MKQLFASAGDGQVFITDTEIRESQIAFSATGFSLPHDFAEKAQEKADLLERRLSRLEQALGLDPIS